MTEWEIKKLIKKLPNKTSSGYDCNKYKYVFAPGTLGILTDTYLVSVSHIMG